MRTVTATRYVTALREGGSLPGLVEADDDGLYVVKFHGAGQGPRALVAEWLGGELARVRGPAVPDLVAELVPGGPGPAPVSAKTGAGQIISDVDGVQALSRSSSPVAPIVRGRGGLSCGRTRREAASK